MIARLRRNLHKHHIKDKPFEATCHVNKCGGGKFKIMIIFKIKNNKEVDRKNNDFIKKIYKPELKL